MRQSRHPHVRILGADCTGKTELCEAVSILEPNIVQFSRTPDYVYDWLRSYGIGRSSTVTRDQLAARERIFLAANGVEMRAVGRVVLERPVVAVRGRADTIITHAVLNDRPVSRSMPRLFPAPNMRPNVLVVLTAPIPAIAERLDARGEAKTGANSLEFHLRCQEAYLEIGNLATKAFPVLVFDTSNPLNTPAHIADQVLGLAV
jgi:thymidylate kinase